ncbi:MAG: hypothetical protein L6R39_006229 [Caloplaca ligustica]|nr:MAG: hypothetical protein L6R39_006229 [Caloplaca ligustica]
MLSFIAGSCFAAAFLFSSSTASFDQGPPAIAFGNSYYTGITFGHPFSIKWFGGDGTPATIRLLGGNVAALQPVITLAAGLTTSPYVWTPVASQSIRSGQPYVLSIEQSGLTNYSPWFTIRHAQVDDQLREQHGAPVPFGPVRYYPLENRAAQDDAKVYNSDVGLHNTGSIFPRTEAIFPRNEGIFRRHYVTGTPASPEVSYAYATGTPTGSFKPVVYATGTSTGSADSLRGAARMSSSPIAYANAARKMDLGWSVVMLVSVPCVLLLLWI